jgi:hypothetical protein
MLLLKEYIKALLYQTSCRHGNSWRQAYGTKNRKMRYYDTEDHKFASSIVIKMHSVSPYVTDGCHTFLISHFLDVTLSGCHTLWMLHFPDVTLYEFSMGGKAAILKRLHSVQNIYRFLRSVIKHFLNFGNYIFVTIL